MFATLRDDNFDGNHTYQMNVWLRTLVANAEECPLKSSTFESLFENNKAECTGIHIQIPLNERTNNRNNVMLLFAQTNVKFSRFCLLRISNLVRVCCHTSMCVWVLCIQHNRELYVQWRSLCVDRRVCVCTMEPTYRNESRPNWIVHRLKFYWLIENACTHYCEWMHMIYFDWCSPSIW